jgi:hypothetical protein
MMEVQTTQQPPILYLNRPMKLHPSDHPRRRRLAHHDLSASLALVPVACPDRFYDGFLSSHFRLPRLHFRGPDRMESHAVNRS